MWRNHPFSQRNKTTKGAVKVEGFSWGRGWTIFENGRARKDRDLHKLEWVANPLPIVH